MLAPRHVTEQEVETARTAVDHAQVALDHALVHALVHAQGTVSLAGTLDSRWAQVKLAPASVSLAVRNLRNTEILAPVSGRITGGSRSVPAKMR